MTTATTRTTRCWRPTSSACGPRSRPTAGRSPSSSCRSLAGPRHFEGERLPLTYANFYVVNGAVLVPVYGDEHDDRAVEILRPLFPDREIVPLMARALITGGGAFHCVTQQQPAGRLWRPE